jgi:IS30 family transposase
MSMTYQQLTYEERILLYGYCKEEIPVTLVAQKLNRNKTTIYRELKRNTGGKGYRFKQAQEKSEERKRNSYKRCKWTEGVENLIIIYLQEEQWSPEQISGYLRKELKISISHQRIYEFIVSDKIASGTLYKHLRQGNKKRRKKYGKITATRGKITNRTPIGERPDYIDKRSTYGHWEGDTIIGKNHKQAIITLVERKGGFCVMGKVSSKNAELVSQKIVEMLAPFQSLVKSITFDNGLEFAAHEVVAKKLKCRTFFADPYCSYQRGTNENTNGLIRQYFPKGTAFETLSDVEIKTVERKLNYRPRKRLDYTNPYNIIKSKVALNT